VSAALRAGESRTGVTIFVMGEELDEGPVVASEGIDLAGDETCDEVTARLADVAADLLVRTLPAWLAGEIEARAQDPAEATYVPRLAKEDGQVPWERPAREVVNHVRAMTSWPGAQTAWQPKVKHEPLAVTLLRTTVLREDGLPAEPTPAPGTVLAAGPEGIDVACGAGVLRILRLHPAGGRALDAREFLNARRVVPGDRFL
jgi:methionyl-tRNA formyltransferase